MITITLSGSWKASGGQYKDIDAAVPGCIHTDLMACGIIPDPYYRDNEALQMWVGEADWTFEREFEAPSELLAKKHINLICHGLDTISRIVINGETIGETDNMHRKWTFDVKQYLKPGKNSIAVTFFSAARYALEKNKERWLWTSGLDFERMEGSNRIRKMHSNFGWDWGPKCVTCGIWRDIELAAYDRPKIADVNITQKHSADCVTLGVQTGLADYDGAHLTAKVAVSFENEAVCEKEYGITAAASAVDIDIQNPKLWWPNNLGEQNLYDVKVSLLTAEGEEIDEKNTRVGLRTLLLDRHADEWGESFGFKVNGVPFFAKGANWIPIDTFVTRGSREFYSQLLTDAKEANMNFIRVWGGGIYEEDIFYDTCDELGLCVWQDFMFACSAYPAYDAEFMENVEKEAAENVIKLRNHPCIALWCGNNEIEQDYKGCVGDDISGGSMTWAEYEALFDRLLAGVVKEYAPGTDYWPSSPHNPTGERTDPNNADSGDAHLWQVWHGRQPFEWYRTCDHRFNSEFGFQSFPEPDVVASFTLPEDRNITSYIMEHHQRSKIGNDAIMQYMLSWFKLPRDFDTLLWLSQILQGMAIKYAVEHWRRKMPQGMGTIYWQINDCWPGASWSSIDYIGNWKALHFMAKRFFSPVLISVLEEMEKGTCELHLTNDLMRGVEGDLTWTLYDMDGNTVSSGSKKCRMGKNSTGVCEALDFSGQIEAHGRRNLILHTAFCMEEKPEPVSENLTYFTRPKHLLLKETKIVTDIRKEGGCEFRVELAAPHPTLWVWLNIPGMRCRYSDNFFDLMPHAKKSVNVYTPEDMTLSELRDKIVISSLADTY